LSARSILTVQCWIGPELLFESFPGDSPGPGAAAPRWRDPEHQFCRRRDREVSAAVTLPKSFLPIAGIGVYSRKTHSFTLSGGSPDSPGRAILLDLKQLDNRAPIADLKRLMDSDPKLGVAFRTAVEKVKSGELTADDLIARLSKSPRKK
jgi:hypothetical protein